MLLYVSVQYPVYAYFIHTLQFWQKRLPIKKCKWWFSLEHVAKLTELTADPLKASGADTFSGMETRSSIQAGDAAVCC